MHESWRLFILSPQVDDWTTFDDATERKRAQNRLAQRAHRKKFGRSRKGSKVNKDKRRDSSAYQLNIIAKLEKRVLHGKRLRPQESSTNLNFVENDLQVGSLDETQNIIPSDNIPRAENTPIWDLPASPQSGYPSTFIPSTAGASVDLSHPDPFADTQFIHIHGMTTIAALRLNAALLNIDCDNRAIADRPKIYLLDSYPTPEALRPTALQVTTPHWPYIDLLPFPSLRDKLLKASEAVDGSEM